MFLAYANIVVVSKAAIASGDLLKPVTSKRVVIVYALAGFSFLLVCGFFDRSKREIEVPAVHIVTSVVGKAITSARAILANREPARLGLISIDDSGLRSWRLPPIAVRGAQVISQAPSGSTWSLLETCLKLLLLFQGITAIVNSSLATVVALIACNRGKVDLKVKELDLELKRLQIVQLQQQLDTQAREFFSLKS
jgi:hypothetical protein